jgi:mono/diheme cytochrome c family protein
MTTRQPRGTTPDSAARHLLRAAASAAMGLVACMAAVMAAAPDAAREGNPFRGREIFQAKGCSRCHSVWGHGGSLGPDITVAVTGKTWDELVGDFWNHTPRMITEVTAKGYSWPALDADEMADTLGYLYYLRLFDRPGDPVRGSDTYARLQCSSCHTLAGRGGRIGGPLDRFGTYPSPTPLAQAMWNAGPRMQREQLRHGSPIPQFTGHEMADLQAYVRAEGRRTGREVELQPLPNPTRGAEVYRAKRCAVCHERGGAPDLTRSALSKTVAEVTGLLWNHSYAMSAAMAARGIPFPRFSGTELSDLIAHLYFSGYAGEDGDAVRGAAVFEQKGCAGCHRTGVAAAPDLSALQRTDRAALGAAMWNHAPQMHRLMAEKAPFWPKFEPGEMRDLVAYVRTLAKVPPAPARNP